MGKRKEIRGSDKETLVGKGKSFNKSKFEGGGRRGEGERKQHQPLPPEGG